MSRLDKVSSCASNSCVAQRQSIRLLIGRLLVRIQSQEPAPRRQSLRGFCLSKLPGLSRTKLPSSRLPTQPPAAYCAALSSRHYLQRRRHLGQPGAAPATPCTSLAPPQPRPAPAWRRPSHALHQPGAVESVQSGVVEPTQCSRARPAPLSGAIVGPKTKPRLPPKTGRQAGHKRFRWGWWCKPRSPTGW